MSDKVVKPELWGVIWKVTQHLRWNEGVLEQAWTNNQNPVINWKPVPQVGEETI